MLCICTLITAHPSKAVVPDESKKAQLRRHRQVERQARRRRRKDARQKEGISPDQHNEGLSTDDEEKESDKQIFVQQIGEFFGSLKRHPPIDHMPNTIGV